jgi:SHS2 domain-containing protein
MRSYKFLSHVADVRLKVEGDSLEELFLAALEGMGNLIKKDACVSNPEQNEQSTEELLKEKIEISSSDTTALLIDFLSEVLTYTQVNKAVYCKAKIEKINNNFLSVTIFGKHVDKFDEDIKAVTYHEAEIKKNEAGNFETVVVFDI